MFFWDEVFWGIANPLGAVWSGAIMLEHLGEAEAGVLISGVRTPDLEGTVSTADVTRSLLLGLPSSSVSQRPTLQ